jgi:hypothetical protein
MPKQTRFTGLMVCVFVASVAPAGADAVTDWNAITVQAAVAAGRPGPTAGLDIALVQAAVHDAVQSIDGRFETYHVRVPGAFGLRDAAVAAAAHDMLVGLFPPQKDALDKTYDDYITPMA